MSGNIPSQVVTRAARRRAEADSAQATGVNVPTTTIQNVTVTVPAPQPANAAGTAPNPTQLVAQGTAPRRHAPAGPRRPRRDHRTPFGFRRRARRMPAGPGAVAGRVDAIASVDEGEDANGDQDQDQMVVAQPEEDEEEQDPGVQDDRIQPHVDDANDLEIPEAQSQQQSHSSFEEWFNDHPPGAYRSFGEFQTWRKGRLRHSSSPRGDEILEEIPVLDNTAGEMMEDWDAAHATPRTATPEPRFLMDRCTSPRCPVPATIPHDYGMYLHDGQLNQRVQRYPFGISNPPPAVWAMVDRLGTPNEQDGDRETVEGFVRNHTFLNELFFEECAGDLVTVR